MNQKRKTAAFTIIELLTVMSIIVLIISMLVPALNAARKYGKVMAQHAQFKSISEGLEGYYRDFDDYPPSDAFDPNGAPAPSCGAMKLCEVMVGQDGLGFHPDSTFARDEVTVTSDLYPFALDPDTTAGDLPPTEINKQTHKNNLLQRAHYLDNETIRASQLVDLYDTTDIGTTFPSPETYHYTVLCDAFPRVTHIKTVRRVGMPILYYKADTAKFAHDVPTADNPGDPRNPDNIYDFRDNHLLTFLATPNVTNEPAHPLYQEGTNTAGEEFYKMTLNKKVTSGLVPYKRNSYILISAGWDGIYGTFDDVTNFNE